MNDKMKKRLPIILLAVTGVLAIIGILVAIGAATPIMKMAEKLMIADEKLMEPDALILAEAILTRRAIIVGIIACLMAVTSLANLVFTLIQKKFTLGFLTVAIMETAYAIFFAIEPMRFSAYFDIAFWMLIVTSCVSFVFYAIDLIHRTLIDVEYRKRLIIIVTILAIDFVLSTIFYFLFGDARADYVEGMLEKYEISMGLYAVVSIGAYAVYTIVIGAVLAIAASISIKSNKKK